MPIIASPYIFGAASDAVDPYLANVVLHLHGDTTNLGLDSSPNTKADGTVGGALARSTANPKFGPSGFATVSVSSYLTFLSHADFGMPGDFTIEMQVYLTTYAATNQGLFNIGQYNTGMMFRVANSATFEVWILGSQYAFATSALTLNAYHEVQVNRQGSTLRFLVDGVLQGATGCSPAAIPQLPITVGAMAHSLASEYLKDGFFDEVRVTKGVARNIANYTPSTEAFPDDPGSLIPPVAPDSQWRILIASNNGNAYAAIWELELQDVSHVNLLNPSMFTSASSYYAGNGPEKAIDGVITGPSAGWLTNGVVSGEWWSVDAGVTIAPVYLKMSSQNPERGLNTFKLQKLVGSTWTDVKSFSGVTWSGETPQTFSLAPPYNNDFSTSSLADFTAYADLGSGTPTWAVASGALSCTGGTSNQCELVYDPMVSADGYVEAVMTVAEGAGLVGRFVDINNHYLAVIADASHPTSPNTFFIYRRQGAHTLITSGSIAPWVRGTPRTFRLKILGSSGSNIYLYDGSTLIANIGDSNVTAAGKWGVYTYGATSGPNSFDSLTIDAA